jgi:hypothetical protein
MPLFSKFRFSRENAEKVVKPPQKPTISKSCRLELGDSVLNSHPISIPMSKLPKTLTVNVPNR